MLLPPKLVGQAIQKRTPTGPLHRGERFLAAELHFAFYKRSNLTSFWVVLFHLQLIWSIVGAFTRVVQRARFRVLQDNNLSCVLFSHNEYKLYQISIALSRRLSCVDTNILSSHHKISSSLHSIRIPIMNLLWLPTAPFQNLLCLAKPRLIHYLLS